MAVNSHIRIKTSSYFALIAGVAIALATLASARPAHAQTNIYVISSGSMSPSLHVNDIITVDQSYPFEDLKVGDIIVFNAPAIPDRVIVHRVAEISPDHAVIRTKGDANPSSIPGTDYPITRDQYIGKVAGVVPGLGVVTRILSPPTSYLLGSVAWGIIIYALYRRRKRQTEVSHSMNVVMPPSDILGIVQQKLSLSKLATKTYVRDQSIVAAGGRDFKWSWLISAIIFAWPAAIAYYLSSKRNNLSIEISAKEEGKSTVIIKTMGRKAGLIAKDLDGHIH